MPQVQRDAGRVTMPTDFVSRETWPALNGLRIALCGSTPHGGTTTTSRAGRETQADTALRLTVNDSDRRSPWAIPTKKIIPHGHGETLATHSPLGRVSPARRPRNKGRLSSHPPSLCSNACLLRWVFLSSPTTRGRSNEAALFTVGGFSTSKPAGPLLKDTLSLSGCFLFS